MQSHRSHEALSPILLRYPLAAGSILQTYNDLVLAQQWTDAQVLDLPLCKRAAIRGRRPQTDDILHVVPCSLAESISTSWLHAVFDTLHHPKEIYLAINSEDSSIVYYKISSGIVKPAI